MDSDADGALVRRRLRPPGGDEQEDHRAAHQHEVGDQRAR